MGAGPDAPSSSASVGVGGGPNAPLFSYASVGTGPYAPSSCTSVGTGSDTPSIDVSIMVGPNTLYHPKPPVCPKSLLGFKHFLGPKPAAAPDGSTSQPEDLRSADGSTFLEGSMSASELTAENSEPAAGDPEPASEGPEPASESQVCSRP